MPGPARQLITRLRHQRALFHVAVFAALAYIPALASAPGKLPADTKLYLYLNPGRLMNDALSAWDPSQFAGSVPHQTVSYLWPSGPWYWVCEHLGVPDWVAHRLWIATILMMAGLGARWAAKHLGLASTTTLVVGVIYQLSPYVLPYISRTSTMLLPWAGLGWMVALTIRATWSRWRDVALFGLVMFTVGSTNATATLMIAPAPVLWLLHGASSKVISWSTATRTALKIGVASLAVSASWVAMVSTQAAYGANVLGYTETLEAVSQTATSNEVVRGFGYWLFYVRDPSGFTTTAAYRYLASGQLIFIGWLLLIVSLLGLTLTRWAHRRYAFALVFIGVVLGVGVHPIGDSSPLMALLTSDTRSGLALALRSSSRAAPLTIFGLALAAGAFVEAIAADWGKGTNRALSSIGWVSRVARLAPVGLAVLAFANLPALWHGELVDPNLTHDQDPPASWSQAAAALDARPSGFRVLQLPGSESAAYRWGYTVDSPLPGLTARPVLARDWTPLGTAAAMDLLYAFDDRFQEGTAEPAAVAAVSRLLAVDTIWVANDIAFDRFRSARPEPTVEVLEQASSLGQIQPFGPEVPNLATLAMVDEQQVSNQRIGEAAASVGLISVAEPQPIARTKTDTVVVSGSGDGVVDAAAAGLIDGSELIIYSADQPGATASANYVIVTDSNRDRAHQWRGAQDVWGFTEDGQAQPGVTKFDSADQRLPVFTTTDPATMTVTEQRGNVAAAASSYGELLAYRPEDRAGNAIDARTETAWIVGDHATPEGQSIDLTFAVAVSEITVVQPQRTRNRWIETVEIAADSRTQTVELTPDSRRVSGQLIALGQPSTHVRITIRTTLLDNVVPGHGLDGVGFAEIITSAGSSEEITRLPTDALFEVQPGTRLDVVMTRLRTRATNRFRSDPEPTMTRAFTLADRAAMALNVTARINQRAPDAVLGDLLDLGGTTASDRLIGAASTGGWAITDGDPTTAWISPFGAAIGSQLTLPTDPSAPIENLQLHQRLGAEFAVITEVSVTSAGQTRVVTVPPPDSAGMSDLTFETLPAGATLTLVVTGTSGATTVDRRYGEVIGLPVGITELTSAGISMRPVPQRFDSGCRNDLITIDGAAISVRITGTTSELLDGQEGSVSLCQAGAINLNAGEHIIRTADGHTTGINVDRLVLTNAAQVAALSDQPQPHTQVIDQTRASRTITVGPCPDQCWLVLAEGFNRGWSATVDGTALAPSQQVDGGFNGWLLPPSDQTRTVVVRWGPQSRLNKGLAISAVSLLVCCIAALFDRRRQQPTTADAPRLARIGLRPDRGVGLRTAIVTGLLGAVCVSPLIGVCVAAIIAICARRPVLIGLLGVAIYVFIAVVMTRQIAVEHPEANFGWPAHWEWLHRAGLAALLLIGSTTRIGASPLPAVPER